MNMKFLMAMTWLMASLSSLSYADSTDNLVKELVRLRSEVEELQSQLDLAKEEHRNAMTALTSQLSDLGIEERRQSVNLEKLNQAIEKIQTSESTLLTDDSELPNVLRQAVVDLYDYVEHSIPFKKTERLAVLTQLRADIDGHLIDSKRAANRLWAFVEDEIRLSKENGIYRQTIDLDGESVLADVAKLGTMFLYFQTSEGDFGLATRTANGWQFVKLFDTQAKEQVSVLFDSLKKQIRQGFFILPNLKPEAI